MPRIVTNTPERVLSLFFSSFLLVSLKEKESSSEQRANTIRIKCSSEQKKNDMKVNMKMNDNDAKINCDKVKSDKVNDGKVNGEKLKA